jgi:hypothetical protein
VIVFFLMLLAFLVIAAETGERAPLVIGAAIGTFFGFVASLLVGPAIYRLLAAPIEENARQIVILAVPLLAVLSGVLPSWLNGGILGFVVSLAAFGVVRPLRPTL